MLEFGLQIKYFYIVKNDKNFEKPQMLSWTKRHIVQKIRFMHYLVQQFTFIWF